MAAVACDAVGVGTCSLAVDGVSGDADDEHFIVVFAIGHDGRVTVSASGVTGDAVAFGHDEGFAPSGTVILAVAVVEIHLSVSDVRTADKVTVDGDEASRLAGGGNGRYTVGDFGVLGVEEAGAFKAFLVVGGIEYPEFLDENTLVGFVAVDLERCALAQEVLELDGVFLGAFSRY